MQISPLWRNGHAGFEQRYRILKIILRNTDLRHKKNDVRVLGSYLVRADQQSQRIHRSRFIGENLGQQIQRFRGFRLECKRTMQYQVRLRYSPLSSKVWPRL